MIKTLALKELREIGPIAVAAVALTLAWFATWAIDLPPWLGTRSPGYRPLWFHDYYLLHAFVFGGFGALLGLLQSVWEIRRRTYLFLLQRPLPRSTIFLTKIGTGIAVLMGASALPILVTGWWLATPGNNPAPFLWSMTEIYWRNTFTLPIVYLGGFHCGLLDASPFGTRLLPLATCAGVTALLLSLPWITPIWLSGTAGMIALMIMSVCYLTRTRDFS